MRAASPFSDGPACLLKTADGQIESAFVRRIIVGKLTRAFGGFFG